ncbi:MAG: hypothetical protein VB122_07415 [Erysipelotrichales bacterium]|nr:hypothetical protein [Erysipelotrichales bacterium]
MLFTKKNIKPLATLEEEELNNLSKNEAEISIENVLLTEKEQNKSVIYNIAEKCDLSKYITSFEKDIEIISKGAFSMHQLVKYIVSMLETPCNIYATTFATTEAVVSILINMKRLNMIDNCYFLLDNQVIRKRPDAYVLLDQNFKCKIASIHAKICVIESKDISVRIIGSGNWTRNDKTEVYSLSSNKNVCNYLKNFILDEINKI